MESQQVSDMLTCVSNKGPLHGLMKQPRLDPTPQEAPASLSLLQQTLTSSQPLYPVNSSNLPLGDTAPVEQPYVSGWASFNEVPPSLVHGQHKSVHRATHVSQSSGLPVESASISQANLQYLIPNAPPSVLHQDPGFGATVQAGVRPKTYPYMQGSLTEVSPKPQHSLKRPRSGSKPAYSVFRQPEWHKQQRAATHDMTVYPTIGGNTSSVWTSPPSRSLSFSDSALEELHTPKHQRDLLNRSLPSNFHSCAITRNSLGSVIPSIDLLPCVPYIPPKCPETLTEAACMYIDYLIQENENIVHISYCEFLQPLTRKKQQEFIAEATKGPCQMPSDKFRAWLKQFNVDVEVVTGEMQQSDDAEDLEDFDASLFLPDMHCEPPSKESPQQVGNLAQFIPGLISEKQPDGTVIIHCLPDDLAKSFAQHSELITQPDASDNEANIRSAVQQDVDRESCETPPSNVHFLEPPASPSANVD